MKIKYVFWGQDGMEISEVMVDDTIGSFILASRKEEHALAERERYHRKYSIDAVLYEGGDFASKTDIPGEELERTEFREEIERALECLTDVQRQRLLLLASGLSLREIARREGAQVKSVHASIQQARKKLKEILK